MPATTTPTARSLATALLVSASVAAGMSLDIKIHRADLQKQLLKFARADLRLALKHGACSVTATRIGRVDLTLEPSLTTGNVDVIRVTTVRGITVHEIATGTIAQLAPIVAGLYDVSDDA